MKKEDYGRVTVVDSHLAIFVMNLEIIRSNCDFYLNLQTRWNNENLV